jgi:hypothetical protein
MTGFATPNMRALWRGRHALMRGLGIDWRVACRARTSRSLFFDTLRGAGADPTAFPDLMGAGAKPRSETQAAARRRAAYAELKSAGMPASQARFWCRSIAAQAYAMRALAAGSALPLRPGMVTRREAGL